MYRVTGIGTSLVLIAAGAILIWAVDVEAEGFNLNNIGVILFVIGIVGLVISLVLGTMSRQRDTLVERDTRYSGQTRQQPTSHEPSQERIVERERF